MGHDRVVAKLRVLGPLVGALFVLTTSRPARADSVPVVTIKIPYSAGDFAPDRAHFRATVSSTYSLRSVTARVGSLTVPVSYNQSVGWDVIMDISTIPHGPATLTITATDVLDGVGMASRVFTHDNPPVVAITSPQEWGVARPNVHVAASCFDDDPGGCTSMTVTTERPDGDSVGCGIQNVVEGVSSIDGTAVLGCPDGGPTGGQVVLGISAVDALGNSSVTYVGKFGVEPSETLHEVASVPGLIVDFDATRILCVPASV